MSERLEAALAAMRRAVASGQVERDTVIRVLGVRASEVEAWRQHAIEEDLAGLVASCLRESEILSLAAEVLRYAGDRDE